MGVLALAGLAASLPAPAQARRYEPAQRSRVGPLDTCLKDEVLNGAFCVKKCAAGFRMEAGKRSASCIAVSAQARIPPPREPQNTPPAKIESGAKGA